MLKTKEVEITWTNNRKIYEPKGYVYTKQGDKFVIKVEDLAPSSHAQIKVICDYCNKEYNILYSQYNNKYKRNIIFKDACIDCSYLKSKETNLLKYGVPVANQLINKFEDIKKQFSNKNLILLPLSCNQLITNNTYLDFICNKHNSKIQKVRFADFKVNCGCTYCSHEKQVLTQLTSYDEICKSFNNKEYKIIDIFYKNNTRYVNYVCSVHQDKVQSIALSSFNQGHGCKYCHYDKNSGENHPNYKGGITPLHNYLRTHLLEWKKDSMIENNYKCAITGQKFDIVHHLLGFDFILQELIEFFDIRNINLRNIKVEDLPENQIKLLKEKCLELHYKHGLGICLKHDIHELFHKNYGYGKNTPEQFEEFKNRYFNNEFNINSMR